MLGSVPLQPPGGSFAGFPLVMLGYQGPGTAPLVPVSGVRATRCCHPPANLFWPKARIPGVFPFATWNRDLASCWVCCSQFGERGAGGPAPKRLLSGRAPAPSPGSLLWAVPQTSLLPQPSSLCGNLWLRQQTLSTPVIHFSWQLLTEMFLCLALF